VSSISFPANFAIRYYQGDLYQFIIRPKNSAGDPFPISNTSHNAYFYISRVRGGESEETIEAQAIISSGNVVCTITPTIGNSLSGQYFYDVSIQKFTDSNELYTLLTGSISVTEDITEPPE
jgi:hypothetical protein